VELTLLSLVTLEKQESGVRSQESGGKRIWRVFLPFNWGREALLGSSWEKRQKAEGRRF